VEWIRNKTYKDDGWHSFVNHDLSSRKFSTLIMMGDRIASIMIKAIVNWVPFHERLPIFHSCKLESQSIKVENYCHLQSRSIEINPASRRNTCKVYLEKLTFKRYEKSIHYDCRTWRRYSPRAHIGNIFR